MSSADQFTYPMHHCTGFHTPEEGVEGHDCYCEIGHDHTLDDFWHFDSDRPDEDDDE